MEQPEAVSSKARNILVVNEVLALESEVIIFIPVAADRQDVVRAFNQRDNVRQHDAGLFARVVFVFVTFKVQIYMALIQGVAVVVQITKACLFVLGFLNVSQVSGGVRQINVDVKACLLKLNDLVLGLAHDVRDAVASIQIRCSVRQIHIFRRNKHRHLTSQIGIIVDLLKR